jgi:WD40 repeat protein
VEDIALAQIQLERRLAAGVRAARQGDPERARELLEGVLRQDRENEQAWIWMASIVTSSRERRVCLERVIKINPRNRGARAAINKMVGVIGDDTPTINFEAISKAAATPLPTGGGQAGAAGATQAGGGGQNLLPLLVGAAVILGLLFVGSLVLPNLLAPAPTATEVAIVAEETVEITEDPSTATITPTSTVASRATIIQRTSQATFTPTVTDTPTNTPLPTATVPAIANYDLVFLAVEGNFAPTLYGFPDLNTEPQPLAGNMHDVDIHPSGVLVYVRNIEYLIPTPTPSSTPTPDPQETPIQRTPRSSEPQIGVLHKMFLTNISNPREAIEISNANFENTFAPSISPDGQQIAFASDADGDDEIYIYDIPSGTIFRVTDNDNFSDIDPDWSPDGTELVFASDRESPQRYELYRLTLGNNAESTVVRVTDTRRGDSLQPQWSPTDNRIVYLNQLGDDSGIRMTTLDGSGAVRELTFQTSRQYSAPSWTSDGVYVVFSSDSGGSLRQILFINPETLQSQTVLTNGKDITIVMPSN